MDTQVSRGWTSSAATPIKPMATPSKTAVNDENCFHAANTPASAKGNASVTPASAKTQHFVGIGSATKDPRLQRTPSSMHADMAHSRHQNCRCHETKRREANKRKELFGETVLVEEPSLIPAQSDETERAEQPCTVEQLNQSTQSLQLAKHKRALSRLQLNQLEACVATQEHLRARPDLDGHELTLKIDALKERIIALSGVESQLDVVIERLQEQLITRNAATIQPSDVDLVFHEVDKHLASPASLAVVLPTNASVETCDAPNMAPHLSSVPRKPPGEVVSLQTITEETIHGAPTFLGLVAPVSATWEESTSVDRANTEQIVTEAQNLVGSGSLSATEEHASVMCMPMQIITDGPSATAFAAMPSSSLQRVDAMHCLATSQCAPPAIDYKMESGLVVEHGEHVAVRAESVCEDSAHAAAPSERAVQIDAMSYDPVPLNATETQADIPVFSRMGSSLMHLHSGVVASIVEEPQLLRVGTGENFSGERQMHITAVPEDEACNVEYDLVGSDVHFAQNSDVLSKGRDTVMLALPEVHAGVGSMIQTTMEAEASTIGISELCENSESLAAITTSFPDSPTSYAVPEIVANDKREISGCSAVAVSTELSRENVASKIPMKAATTLQCLDDAGIWSNETNSPMQPKSYAISAPLYRTASAVKHMDYWDEGEGQEPTKWFGLSIAQLVTVFLLVLCLLWIANDISKDCIFQPGGCGCCNQFPS